MVGYLLGLAAIGGGVFLLQRLRVQRHERVVPTLLFWQAALRETQARKLTERFRDPLVFLLLFAIGALLWTTALAPSAGTASARDHWVVVDGSAALARGAAPGQPGPRAVAARERLDAALRAKPRANTSAWLVAEGAGRALLLPGEALPLWDARFDAQALPERSGGSAAETAGWIVTAAAARASEASARGLSLTLIATAPVLDAARPALQALAEAHPAFGFEEVALPDATGHNEGLLDFRAEPAASGAADRADLWVLTSGAGVEVTGATAPTALQAVAPGTFVLRDVALDGATVVAALASDGDALAADDRATLELPTAAIVEAHFGNAWPGGDALSTAWRASLASILREDSGLALSADTGVALRYGAASIPPGTPALVLDPTATSLRVEGPQTAAFAALFDALGLGPLPKGLPDETGQLSDAQVQLMAGDTLPFEARETTGPRRLVIPAALIAAPFEWREERRLPLLVGLGLRWLAGVEEPSFRGHAAVSLPGTAITLEAPSSAAPELRTASVGARNLWPWLGVLALGLLLFEWRQVTRGRMP